MLLQKLKELEDIQIQCIIQCYVRNYLHFWLYELYAIFNKVHKVKAINKVQKVRTSQLWKLFVIKQSPECIFMPKMQKNTFGGRAEPLGELVHSPDPI